jgi:hypothetical protein
MNCAARRSAWKMIAAFVLASLGTWAIPAMAADGPDLNTVSAIGPMGGCGARLPGRVGLFHGNGGRMFTGESWKAWKVLMRDVPELTE